MKKLVIIPGGFHPYHAGHKALYDAAREAFPSAEVYVAATDDTTGRPFPFRHKKFLAQQAGIPANRFIQVKSPFSAEEIKQHFDENDTQLIFVRSEKDRDQNPQPGQPGQIVSRGPRKGMAPYLQPYRRNGLQPMKDHAYITYLPTVQFGPGMTSATEIRAKWPTMTAEQKAGLVKIMYPMAADNEAKVAKIVEILDTVMSAEQKTDEAVLINDPDAGHQIVPDGGMGTWDEASLVSNLARKFASMVDMVKVKNYTGLQYVLYQDRVVKSMVDALAQYEQFMKKQGRRPLARGKEVDMSPQGVAERVRMRMPVEEAPDYVEEGDVVQFPPAATPPEGYEQAKQLAFKIVDIAKDASIRDPGPQLAPLRRDLQMLGWRIRMDQGGMRLIHTRSNWNTIIDPMK